MLNDQTPYQVRLVSPKVWRYITYEAFGLLDVRQRLLAESILKTMHDRHVGATPELVAELAPMLLDFKTPESTKGAWPKVFRRLINELALAGYAEGGAVSGKRQFGILFNANPMYAVFRLAMPVVEQACRSIRRCCLFCEDDIPNAVRRNDYLSYSKAISNRIESMADNEDGELSGLFWKDRAAALSSFSRQLAKPGNRFSLPETEPASLALLLRLEPDIPWEKNDSRRIQRLAAPMKHRRVRKQKQDGVDGIQITRREDDLNGILLSEFLNDDVILADRLVNTGFFASRREPKREKMRDVLIAGIMPWYFSNSLNPDFIKACWFDALARFSLMLRGGKLLKSQFRWIEGDRFGQMRACDFFLEDMYTFETGADSKPSRAYRGEFLSALRWLPSFLDTRDGHVPAKEANGSAKKKTGIEELKTWAYSAWSKQMRKIADSPDMDTFSFVHVMVFLPSHLADSRESLEDSSHLGPLFKGFRIGNRPGRNVSITWTPDKTEDLGQWAFAARERAVTPLFPSGDLQTGENKIAGKIVGTWYNQWIREIWLG